MWSEEGSVEYLPTYPILWEVDGNGWFLIETTVDKDNDPCKIFNGGNIGPTPLQNNRILEETFNENIVINDPCAVNITDTKNE